MALKLSTLLMLLTTGGLNFIGITADDCKLNPTDMDRHWIFLTKPSANTWDILRSEYVKDQTSYFLLCDDKTAIKEIFCNHGVWKHSDNRKVDCKKRYRAEVELNPVTDNSCRFLGGKMYDIVYNLPHNVKISLYQVCYNEENQASIFTRHKTYGFHMPATNYGRPHFRCGREVTKACVDSYKTKNVYKRFNALLGHGQNYIPTDTSRLLERGHLVNCQDLITHDQMDETCLYINIVPQFFNSNHMNWDRIEDWVNKLPARNTYAEVVSGVYGILKLPHSNTQQLVDMYLMDNNKNPIPEWLYKVVKYNNKCYAFVNSNNQFNTNPNYNTPICQSVACPEGFQFSSNPNATVAYCCNYNHLVRYVGNHARLC